MGDDQQVARLQAALGAMRRRIAFIEGSRFWKLRESWMRIKASAGFNHDPAPPALPPQSWAELLGTDDPYARWLLRNDPRPADLERLERAARLLPIQPSFALILDDAAEPGAPLAGFDAQDVRMRLVRTSLAEIAGGSLAARYNAAMSGLDVDFVAFCDPHIVLAPGAAAELTLAVNAHPAAVAIYSDFDTIEASGTRSRPRFSPDWSPETFLSSFYTGRLIFYRRRAVEAAGGFSEAFPGAEHYDLALRVTENAHVAHVRSILWHDLGGEAAQDAAEAAAAAAATSRRGEPAAVTPISGVAGAHDVRYPIAGSPWVDIIIPTRDHAQDLERCVESILTKSTYSNYRILVVDNQSREERIAELIEKWRKRLGDRFDAIPYDRAFNFAAIVNLAAAGGRAPFLLLLNNDTEVIAPGWIEALLEEAQRPPIGAVGAQLLYADETLQHAGVTLGADGLAAHVRRGAVREPLPELAAKRNYAALTAACMMVRRDAFERAHGFDETFPGDYNDVDFCLRLMKLGYRNVFAPRALLYHFESKTRGSGDTPEGRRQRRIESERFLARWPAFRDPYAVELLED